MGNIFTSFYYGFTEAIGSLFQAPLDFIKGKSCSSECGITWDIFCYIDHFCIVNIVKILMVLALIYLIMLFIYLLYKVGITDCISRNICKMTWGLISSCCSASKYCFLFLWNKLAMARQTRPSKELDRIEEDIELSEGGSYSGGFAFTERERSVRFERSASQRTRDRRKLQYRRSLQPRRQQKTVEICMETKHARERSALRHAAQGHTIHKVKVTHRKSMGRRPPFINL